MTPCRCDGQWKTSQVCTVHRVEADGGGPKQTDHLEQPAVEMDRFGFPMFAWKGQLTASLWAYPFSLSTSSAKEIGVEYQIKGRHQKSPGLLDVDSRLMTSPNWIQKPLQESMWAIGQANSQSPCKWTERFEYIDLAPPPSKAKAQKHEGLAG